ncbi:DDE-type integrase/transposase/recombinase [Bacillus sp. ISL-75]|nr:DDE-type integrase/transposase/recombinase [Bacillus sp. ISL-75]MBT2730541.1 DDE-type integrase/transposase/recombinase [Bacillus sp. ISL-75]
MKRLTITLLKKQRKFLKDISKAAKRFFKKALAVCHSTTPRVVTVDENPAYPLAIEQLKEEKLMPEGVKMKSNSYISCLESHHKLSLNRSFSSMSLSNDFCTRTIFLTIFNLKPHT